MKRLLAMLLSASILLCGCSGGKGGDQGEDTKPQTLGTALPETIPVIIDVDTGTDDALALLAANKSDGLEIRGITVVQGCVDLQQAGENTRKLSSTYGIDATIALGAETPLKRDPIRDIEHHGGDGLGGYQMTGQGKLSELSAVDFIKQEAERCDGKLQIIALGPLTNIAQAVETYPELEKKIARIIAACGNTDPSKAEFNAKNDPEALQIVLQSGIPVDLVTWQVTNLNPEEVPDDKAPLMPVNAFRVAAQREPASSLDPLYRAFSESKVGNQEFSMMAVSYANFPGYLDLPELVSVTCNTTDNPGALTIEEAEQSQIKCLSASSVDGLQILGLIKECY